MTTNAVKVGICIAAAMVLTLGGCRKKADSISPAVEEKTTAADADAISIGWITDFAAAQKKAVAEGKDLLINFTGSDWCIWCKRLDAEVFNQKMFISEAQTKFVFVLLDFPSDTSGQTAELQKQNKRLMGQYDVQGFPTIILADAMGKPYAQTGYQEGGPMAYLQHLAELRLQRPAK